jgi:hypothetical protein
VAAWFSHSPELKLRVQSKTELLVLTAFGKRQVENLHPLYDFQVGDGLGCACHARTVPMPDWVKQAIDHWLSEVEIAHGRIFRCVIPAGRNVVMAQELSTTAAG